MIHSYKNGWLLIDAPVQPRSARIGHRGRRTRAESARSPSLDSAQLTGFLDAIDSLYELLTPERRPEDRDEPECSRTELRILGALGRVQPITMTALAGVLRIPLSTATRAVDKLVDKGFVERRRDARDRRLVRVVLSARGRRINRYVVRARSMLARELFSRLGPKEVARMVAQLTRLAGA